VESRPFRLGRSAGTRDPAAVFAGIAATCNALSSAQLAAEFPQSGGTYEYGYRVLNPWAGYVAGWMFLASKISAAGAVALGLAAAVGADGLAATAAPLRVAADAFPLPWVATAVSVGGVTAMLGVILSQLLGLSRMAFAMARRRDLPALLDQVHPRHAVPSTPVQ
jgi:amino acid transporter